MTPARTARLIALLVVTLLAMAAWQRPELLEGPERWTFDRRIRLRGPRPASGEVVIVAIDDATSSRAPEIFTRRAGLAGLVRAIRAQGASVIGMDLFFSEPEALLGEEIPGAITSLLGEKAADPEGPARELLGEIQELLSGDTTLEEALLGARDVVLALYLGDRSGPVLPDRVLRRGTYGQFAPGSERHRNASRVLASIPPFTRAAVALGTVNIEEDPDKIVRALSAVSFHKDRAYAPLSLQVLAQHLGFGRGGLAYSGDPPRISYGDRRVILAPGHRLLLNVRGRAAFPTYSAIDVVEKKLPPGALQGKMALVGITYLGHDAVHTPLDTALPGVNIHAEAIENFLAQDFVSRTLPGTDAFLTFGVGLLLLLLFGSGLRRWPLLRIALSVLLFGGYAGVACFLLAREARWIPLAAPGLAFATALLGSLGAGWLQEGRRRRQLRHTFAHYLAPSVIRELIRHPESLAPGGARRELSVLFSDIRSFTTLSEKLSPEEVVAFLGRYLDPMTAAVIEAGGLLDKYIGDAIMAIFGAPLSTPAHATQALDAALAMHLALERVRMSEQGDLAALRIGLGINTGEMVVGNMGASNRFDYTVIGDAVNLASRLESLTKTYGVFCLVGENTVAAAPERYVFREVDRVRVKGKAQAVTLHELLAGPGRSIATYEDLPGFVEGLSAWRTGDFDRARAAFDAFARSNPLDPVATLYRARLEAQGARAPQGWDGIFTFESK